MVIVEQKIALVTGASNGMGLETALALTKKGIFVVMLCRNRQRGEAAMEYIKTKSGCTNVALLLCDLGDMQDIRKFCEDFKKTYTHLDILINNAGVLNFNRLETKDGLEMNFGVSHIGHFLLTNLLLECMSENARIVMVGSVAHKVGKIHFDDLGLKHGYSLFKAYSQAKLCNMLFTKEMSRRLKGTNITINCVHPGAVVTNIGAKRKEGKTSISLARKIAGIFLAPFVKTPKQGAATAIYVATSEECANMQGMYFANCKPAKESSNANNEELAKKLWEVSEKITDNLV